MTQATHSTVGLAVPGVPLCIDLDGTLVRSNTMLKEISVAVRKKPFRFLPICLALFRGRAEFKKRVSSLCLLDISSLPYRQSLLDLIWTERANGRQIILATGAHEQTAEAIASHLRCFDNVLSTKNGNNLTGNAKRQRLVECFPAGFYYAGDSNADLPVWQAAVGAILVGTSNRVQRNVVRRGINVVLILK
jgi:phosphoserine phosphatase